MTSGIGDIFAGPYFSWYRLPETATNIRHGIDDLKAYIVENGPYDGAIGFSQGAQMLIGLILEHQSLHPFEPALFQVAIFFSGVIPQEQRQLVAKGLKIRVPTAHILGGKKDFAYEGSLQLRDVCHKDIRTEYEHGEGHCIPRKLELVVAITNVIRKSIYRAIYRS
jgi:Serine hydrolase (FSH1)